MPCQNFYVFDNSILINSNTKILNNKSVNFSEFLFRNICKTVRQVRQIYAHFMGGKENVRIHFGGILNIKI